MRQMIILIAATVALTGVSGCGTVEGIGRDISGGSQMVRGWFGGGTSGGAPRY